MEVGTFRVLYELKMRSGKKQILTLEYTADEEILEESCEILFCQAKNNDTLTVVKDVRKMKSKKKSRVRAPSETLLPEFGVSKQVNIWNYGRELANMFELLKKVDHDTSFVGR